MEYLQIPIPDSADATTLLQQLMAGNLLALAFVGDAVHTLYVRMHVLQTGQRQMQNYHTAAAASCKAATQARAMERMLPDLSPAEAEIVRRARNAKPKHTAKHATELQYRLATMFEALIGYLYLIEAQDRLQQLLELSIL